MRYSEMIAREKHRTHRHGDMPGGLSDLRRPLPRWVMAVAVLILLIAFV